MNRLYSLGKISLTLFSALLFISCKAESKKVNVVVDSAFGGDSIEKVSQDSVTETAVADSVAEETPKPIDNLTSSLGFKGKVKSIIITPKGPWMIGDSFTFKFSTEGVFKGKVGNDNGSKSIENFNSQDIGVSLMYRSGRLTGFNYSAPDVLSEITFEGYNSDNLPTIGKMEYDNVEKAHISWLDMDSHGNYQVMKFDKKNMTDPLDGWCPDEIRFKFEYWSE